MPSDDVPAPAGGLPDPTSGPPAPGASSDAAARAAALYGPPPASPPTAPSTPSAHGTADAVPDGASAARAARRRSRTGVLARLGLLSAPLSALSLLGYAVLLLAPLTALAPGASELPGLLVHGAVLPSLPAKACAAVFALAASCALAVAVAGLFAGWSRPEVARPVLRSQLAVLPLAASVAVSLRLRLPLSVFHLAALVLAAPALVAGLSSFSGRAVRRARPARVRSLVCWSLPLLAGVSLWGVSVLCDVAARGDLVPEPAADAALTEVVSQLPPRFELRQLSVERSAAGRSGGDVPLEVSSAAVGVVDWGGDRTGDPSACTEEFASASFDPHLLTGVERVVRPSDLPDSVADRAVRRARDPFSADWSYRWRQLPHRLFTRSHAPNAPRGWVSDPAQAEPGPPMLLLTASGAGRGTAADGGRICQSLLALPRVAEVASVQGRPDGSRLVTLRFDGERARQLSHRGWMARYRQVLPLTGFEVFATDRLLPAPLFKNLVDALNAGHPRVLLSPRGRPVAMWFSSPTNGFTELYSFAPTKEAPSSRPPAGTGNGAGTDDGVPSTPAELFDGLRRLVGLGG